MSPDHNTHLPTLYLKHAGWDTLEKLALAALDQGNLEVADVRVPFHAPLLAPAIPSPFLVCPAAHCAADRDA